MTFAKVSVSDIAVMMVLQSFIIGILAMFLFGYSLRSAWVILLLKIADILVQRCSMDFCSFRISCASRGVAITNSAESLLVSKRWVDLRLKQFRRIFR